MRHQIQHLFDFYCLLCKQGVRGLNLPTREGDKEDSLSVVSSQTVPFYSALARKILGHYYRGCQSEDGVGVAAGAFLPVLAVKTRSKLSRKEKNTSTA